MGNSAGILWLPVFIQKARHGRYIHPLEGRIMNNNNTPHTGRNIPVHRRLVLILGAGALLLLIGCNSLPTPVEGSRPSDVVQETHLEPQWIQEGLVYELFVRDFTPEGTFRAIIPRLEEIRELGVETIWLMPIHPIGEEERKGRLGSPYSIRDYYTVDPAYGSEADFQALVDAVHRLDMHIIIDLVVNHTAWDHPWVEEHPEWYTRDGEGNIVPPVEDWSDVADLDFSNQELREELTRIMKYWVSEFNIDGYRVDTASMIPPGFWKESIPRVKEVKPVLFLGETNDPALSEAGYQLIYSWDSYGWLKNTAEGGSSAIFVAGAERQMENIEGASYLRFITNHDETAWDAPPPVLFDSQEGAMAMAVAHMFMPGVPLVYNGQEIGNEDSWAFFDKWNYDWSLNPEVRDFYVRLGEIWQQEEALRFGDMRRIRLENSERTVGYLRRTQNDELLILVNTGNEKVHPGLPPELHGSYTELFSKSLVQLDGESALEALEYGVYSKN